MSKPNTSTESIAQHLTEVQQLLKSVTEHIDHIRSQPFIPSIRQDQLAFLQDKVDNLSANIHSMGLQLAHFG